MIKCMNCEKIAVQELEGTRFQLCKECYRELSDDMPTINDIIRWIDECKMQDEAYEANKAS